MRLLPKSKKLRIAIAVFFVSGLVFGAAGGYYWGKNSVHRKMSPADFKQHLYTKTVNELQLTPEQENKIKPIFEQRFEKINLAMVQSRNELISIIAVNYDAMAVHLTPEQLPKLTAMKQRSITRLQEKMKEKF
jgi:Spy/CpxP family protein refolding chaperone